MSFQGGSQGLHKTGQYTTLLLVGGQNVNANSPGMQTEADLRVAGGCFLGQDLFVTGLTTLKGNVNVTNVDITETITCQTINANVARFALIEEELLGQGITVEGNVFFANTVTFAAPTSFTNLIATSSSDNIIVRGLWNSTGASSVSTYASSAPSVGQTLVATSATTATWQTISGGTGGVTFGDTEFAVYNATDNTKRLLVNNVLATTATATTIATTQIVNETLVLPNVSDTLVGRSTTDTLTNKILISNTDNVLARSLWNGSGAGSVSVYAAAAPSAGQALIATTSTTATWQSLPSGITPQVTFGDTQFTVYNTADNTKTLLFTNASATTGTATTIATTQTVNETLTLPNVSDTLVGRSTTDTLINKTLTTNTNNIIARGLWNGSGAGSVSVYAATAPSIGQVLTATSSSLATWQTPAGGSGTKNFAPLLQIVVPTALTSNITAGQGITDLIFDGYGIWTSLANSNDIVRVSTKTGLTNTGYVLASEGILGGLACTTSTVFCANNNGSTTPRLYDVNTIGLPGIGSFLLTGAGSTNFLSSVAYDGTHLWVTDYAGTVAKCTTSAFLTNIAVGTNPYGVAFDGTNIWVANFGSNDATVINPTTNAIVATHSLGAPPYSLAYDGNGFMWFVTSTGNILKVNITNGSIAATVSYTTFNATSFQRLNSVCFDGNNMWVVLSYLSTSSVLIISTTTNQIISSFSLATESGSGITFDGQYIYIPAAIGAGSPVIYKFPRP